MNWLDFCEESTFRLAEFNHLCTSLCPVRLTRMFALISLISILEIKGLKYLLSDQKIDKYWRFYSNYSFDFVTVLEESTEKSQVIYALQSEKSPTRTKVMTILVLNMIFEVTHIHAYENEIFETKELLTNIKIAYLNRILHSYKVYTFKMLVFVLRKFL
jgi:hypothetical protein